MKVLRDVASLRGAFNRPVVTIGNFDGLHRGHRFLLGKVVEEAARRERPAVVLTFDRHPLSVVAPERCPSAIQTAAQKLEGMAELGFDGTCLLPVTASFLRTGAEEFVHQILVGGLGISAILVGEDFAFGHHRLGNIQLLRSMGPLNGFDVLPVPILETGEVPLSSTLIRACLAEGRMEDVTGMLGRPYSVDGRVVEGRGLGRQLGYPTANVGTSNELIPPCGVYVVTCRLRGDWLPAIASLGIRPTVDTGVLLNERHRLLEVHLLDRREDCYGEEIRVRFHHHLRREERFSDLDELKTAISRDVDHCRNWFQNNPVPA